MNFIATHLRHMVLGVLFSSTVFFFTGCIDLAQDEHVLEGDPVNYVGTLKSLGEVIVDGKADHILEADNGEVYYVYSSFIDLEKPKYKNARLQINGEIMSITDSGKEVIAIESIIPMTEEVIERDSISETPKKYQNLEMGFRLENLIGFEIDEKQNQISFTKTGATFTVTRFDNTTKLTLDEWLDLDNITSRTPVFVGPDKLKGYLRDSANSPIYFVSRTNDYIYEIDLLYTDESLGNELKAILNSFRFVPIQETVEEENNAAALTAPSATSTGTSHPYEAVESYFIERISEYAPDYGETEYPITQFEFVRAGAEKALPADNQFYVYIAYDTHVQPLRLLMGYDLAGGTLVNVKTHAFFAAGYDVDWGLSDGEDLTKGFPVTVRYNNESKKMIDLQEGFRLFESGPFDFSIQYPSHWYVQGQSGKYLFNDEPLDGTYLISVEAQRKKIEDVIADIPFTFESIDLREDRAAFIAHPKDTNLGVYIVLSRNDGAEAYVLWSLISEKELLKVMAQSILEN